MESPITTIADAIKSNSSLGSLIIIGIEGFGGSGKTTIANKLAELLGNSFVINIDDFIIKEKLIEPSWNKSGFDRERLEQQVLKPARAGHKIQYQRLLWDTDMLSSPKQVPDVDYLIIEGTSCYHPNIAHYYDYKVWVDTPIAIAKERGKTRDAGNENADKWDMWAQDDLAYQQNYHPEQLADFTINNN
jgi:uridine kinase